MSEIKNFKDEVKKNINSLGEDKEVQALSHLWIEKVSRHKWSYNFTWLDRPAIQFPNDTWILQELIWSIKPDLIIETGIAHGGSVIFNASMLALLDVANSVNAGESLDFRNLKRKVIGIDIDIRDHNREKINEHPMSPWIHMIEGSSIDSNVIEEVHEYSQNYDKILVCLDSNHTHDHVLAELQAYAPLVSQGSYCVVFDTIIEDLPDDFFPERPWGVGNNPKTAIYEYLKDNDSFEIDSDIPKKLQITVAPDGFLKRI